MNTTLRAYLDELKLLLEQEALDEVTGHCRHILQHYPKNVETYRFLGRALLEKNRYSEASDIFQRVLSALPDDFVSHLALSAIAEEDGQIPPAIWHLERAYELEPNNTALRDEIKRLYERRDGMPPARIELSRGGLAHIYAKSRLYEQATVELEAGLAQMPERVDLMLLLAHVLWESDHPVEASEMALRAMEKAPNSIEANRIIASLWLKAGRPSDAAPFVSRLEQLDPFLAWDTIHTDGTPVPRNAFQLPRLDWDARAAAALATDVPDWVSSISNVFEAPQSVPLAGNGDAGRSSGMGISGAGQINPAADIPVEIPDWFNQSSGSTESSAATGAAISDDEVPDWFKTDTSAAQPASVGGEGLPTLPDWLEDEPAASTADAPTESAASAAPEIPSWLDDELPDVASMTDSVAQTADSSATPVEIPDWLSDADPASAAPATPEPEPSAAGQPLDAMSWLVTGSLPPLEEAGKAAAAAMAEQSNSAPDWLSNQPQDSGETEFPDLDSLTSQMPPAAEAAPEWLSADTFSAPTPEPAASTESSLDWLSNESSTDDLLASLNLGGDEPAPAADSEPAWLASPSESGPATPAMPEPAVSAESDMDWLSGVSPEDAVASSAPVESASLPSDLFANLQSSPITDDLFAGLSSTSDETEAEPEPAANAEPGLDWLSSGSSVTDDLFAGLSSTSDETEAEPEPAANAEPGLDWLSSGSSATDDLFAGLSSTPTEMEAEPEPAANAEPGLDWLSSGSSATDDLFAGLSSTPTEMEAEPEPAASAEPGLDWPSSGSSATEDLFAGLSSTPDETEAESEPAASAEPGLDWLSSGGSSSDDLLASLQIPAEPAETETRDWFSGVASGASDTELSMGLSSDLEEDEQIEALHPGETPSWLAGMAPQTGLAQPVESLDFSSLETPTDTESSDWLAPASESKADDWLAGFAESAAPGGTSPIAEAPQDALEEVPPAPLSDTKETPLAPRGLRGTDWLTQKTPVPDTDNNVELEEDWLASFEATPSPDSPDSPRVSTGTMQAAPLAESFSEPTTASDSGDWLGSFEGTVIPPEEETPAAAQGDDWLGSLGSVQAAPAAAQGDDWLGSLGSAAPDASAETASASAEDSPAWLRDVPAVEVPGEAGDEISAATEGKDHFGKLLEAAGQRSPQAPPVNETGVLDPAALPDWLSAMGDEGATDAADIPLDTFASAAAAPELSEESSWLSGMQFGSEEVTATEFASTDAEESNPPEGEAAVAGEAPDWLASIAPAAQRTPEVTPDPLDSIDFSSLVGSGTQASTETSDTAQPDWLATYEPADTLAQTEPTSGGSPASTDFTFDRVAQPANLVNTNPESGAASFTFDHTPAWLRKKKGAAKPPTRPTAQTSGDDDLPDWLKQ